MGMRKTGVEAFILDSEGEKRLHPRARELINSWIATIVQIIPQLAALDKDQIAKDVASYLNDDEKITFTNYLANISGYLSQCKDNTLYPALTSLNRAMSELSLLFVTVYRRKAEKAEAERRKTEAEQGEREEQARKKAEAERKKREDKAKAEWKERVDEKRELVIIKPEQRQLINPCVLLEKLDEGIRDLVDPYALEKFDKFRDDLKQAHLGELAQADFNRYLSQEENQEAIKLQAIVVDWFIRCSQPEISIETRYSTPYYAFEDLRKLVRKVYERKQAEQKELEEQQRKLKAEKERREMWDAACKAVNPPLGDAKRYLDEPGEYDKFKKAAVEAIHVYLEEGGEYLDDTRTFDYRWWLDTINRRKDEEIRKANQRKEDERREAAAESEAREYNQSLNNEVAGLKRSLCPSKKDHGAYFKEQVDDPRYLGYSFNHVLTDEHKQTFGKSIMSIAKRELDKLVPEDFREFIDSKCLRSFFLLPSVDYSSKGVPCLDFTFDVFAVVETRVWLKPGQKSFGGYTFQFPWRGEEGGSVLAQEPEFLGYHYHILTPSDLDGYVFWQSIPLTLLKGLLNGETKPAGATVSAAWNSAISYKVAKFKEEVVIPDSFASYLREIKEINQMVTMGIMSEKLRGIVKSELLQLKAGEEASPLEGKIKRRESKKTRVFQLFSQGKRPGDADVKRVGLKPKTVYRYYQEWKKVQHSSQNAT